jgi:hypothetical protein
MLIGDRKYKKSNKKIRWTVTALFCSVPSLNKQARPSSLSEIICSRFLILFFWAVNKHRSVELLRRPVDFLLRLVDRSHATQLPVLLVFVVAVFWIFSCFNVILFYLGYCLLLREIIVFEFVLMTLIPTVQDLDFNNTFTASNGCCF